jgi:hypothetical protein
VITEAQAAEMIALLREIRDELAAPRLARERHNEGVHERTVEHQRALAAAQAADAAKRAERATLWAGGAGIPTVRELPAGETPT